MVQKNRYLNLESLQKDNSYLSESYIEKNAEKLDWQELSLIAPINCYSFDFISKFSDKWNWLTISCRNKTLSEDLIDFFENKVDWECISKQQTLSESFIEKHQKKVDWFFISFFQNLSENFIRKFQDKVSWPQISVSQKLSESFVKEFQNKVDWFNIFWNKKSHFSQELKKQFRNRILK